MDICIEWKFFRIDSFPISTRFQLFMHDKHIHTPCYWHYDWISISFPICYIFFRWCNLTVVVSCKCAIDKSKFNFYKSLSHFYLKYPPDMLSSIQAHTFDALKTYFSLWKIGNFANTLQIEKRKRIVKENRKKIEMINKDLCNTMYNSMRCDSISLFCSSCWCWCCRCHWHCHFCINVTFVSYLFFSPQIFDECRVDGRKSWIVHLCIQHSKWMLSCNASINLHRKAMLFTVQSWANTMYFPIHSALSTLNLDICTLYTLTHLQFTYYFVNVDNAHCTRSIFPSNWENCQFYIVASHQK